MTVKYVDEIELEGKKVFLRADLNVPLKDGQITDDTRIQAVLPTIRHILRHGQSLVLASHLGRPKGQVDPKFSMVPVGERLAELLGETEVVMAESVISDGIKVVAQQLLDGQILLLENLRFNPGETINDPELSEQLAGLADVYVNDAFGSCHRAHASIAGITNYMSTVAGGFLLRKELKYFKNALEDPEQPFVAILGGAKVSDKIGVIENLLKRVQVLIIGGGMAYTFLKQMGYEVGKSLVENDKLALAEELLKKAELRDVKILLPIDHVCAQSLDEGAPFKTCEGDAMPADWMGVDIGPKTIELFNNHLKNAATIVWNGPMGVFENPDFAQGTFTIAESVAASNAISIIGGGDSVAAIKKAGVADRVSHISTGGGASLELLEGKILPGVAALDR